MIRHNLPSGAWADLRDVADVTERMRRPIKRTQAKLGANAEFLAAVQTAQGMKGDGEELSQAEQLSIAAGLGAAFDDLEALNDLLVAALVAGWSYGFEPSADACQDIPAGDLDALREICAPLMTQLMPGFEPTPDPDSPTTGSTV